MTEETSLPVVVRSIKDLIPYARNSNKHSEEQLAQIIASITEFGWTNPILADDFVRAGHGRLIAAQRIYAKGGRIKLPSGKLLPDGMVPVIDCTGWSDSQRRAYVITDNQVARNAEWDLDILKIEIDDLRAAGDIDIMVLGFSPKELKKIDAEEGPGNVPESKYKEQYGIIVMCDSEQKQEETFTVLTESGYSCKVVTT